MLSYIAIQSVKSQVHFLFKFKFWFEIMQAPTIRGGKVAKEVVCPGPQGP